MKRHSVVRLITNSSSETYMFVKDNELGVQRLHDFITGVLKAAGSDKTSEELFTINLVDQWSYIDSVVEYAKEVAAENGTTVEEELSDHWMASQYPDGIKRLEVVPLPDVTVDRDLTALIMGVFEAAEIGSEW